MFKRLSAQPTLLILLPLLLLLQSITISTVTVNAQKFDPYQLNGGLVAAVAGRDYVILASDTRLTNGGYGVNCRRYLSGRIWCASSSSSSSSIIDSTSSDELVDTEASTSSTTSSTLMTASSSSSSSLSSSLNRYRVPVQWEPDGSLALPSKQNFQFHDSTQITTTTTITTAPAAATTTTVGAADEGNNENRHHRHHHHPQLLQQTNTPVMVGSAGCASDCEALKRRVRLELDALESSFPSSPPRLSSTFSFTSCNDFTQSDTTTAMGGIGGMGVQSVANLLQQILYGRRGFPFYSFCVVAGIDWEDDGYSHHHDNNNNNKNSNNNSNNIDDDSHGGGGRGAVYVYDAIGSYERVAVGSAGTGRELLQPILDRLFSETSKITMKNNNHNEASQKEAMSAHADSGGCRTITPIQGVMTSALVTATQQRRGVAGSLRPPVQTTVDCSWEEAVRHIVRGYRSVAEREISVGDEVVVCVVRTSRIKNSNDRDHHHDDCGGNNGRMDVFSFPLKKH